jgi:hypothetical protein
MDVNMDKNMDMDMKYMVSVSFFVKISRRDETHLIMNHL